MLEFGTGNNWDYFGVMIYSVVSAMALVNTFCVVNQSNVRRKSHDARA